MIQAISKESVKSRLEKDMCEQSYYEFCRCAFKQIESETEFLSNWHIKYICAILQVEIQRIAKGLPRRKDIIINVPPRSMKSYIVSVLLNAWAWTRFPHLKFITTSYSGELAIDQAVITRRLIETEWYQNKWPFVQFEEDENRRAKFANTMGGFRKSTGTGGNVTGTGGDIIICDDPQDPLGADSEADRKSTLNWYRRTFYNRLNNSKVGLRIIIMQRLHMEDVTGFLLDNGDYRHICIPVEETGDIKPAILKKQYKDGLFWPEKFGRRMLDDYRRELGSYGFTGQYLQRPVPEEGGIWKIEWWQYYAKLPEVQPSNIIQSWDTAFKKGENNDYSVCSTWYQFDEDFYLVDITKERYEFPELKRMVKSLYEKYRPYKIIVEDKASGQSLIQELKRDGALPVYPVKVDRDKIARANAVSPIIEQGRVYLPESASWVSEFIKETSNFPFAPHDDQVDSVSQGLSELLSLGRSVIRIAGIKDVSDNQEPNPKSIVERSAKSHIDRRGSVLI